MLTMFRPMNAGLFQQFDRDLARMFDGVPAATLTAPAEVIETEAALSLRVDLPGIPESDVKVSVENNILTVQATRKAPEDPKGSTRHLAERAYGTVKRSFRLPHWVESAEASAKFEHGALTITLPRKADTRPRAIEIKVGS